MKVVNKVSEKKKTTKICIYLMVRDIFHLSRFATLHLRSAKFCSLGRVLVLVLVFASIRLVSSSSDNVENLAFSILLLKESRGMKTFRKSARLNSSVVN